MEREYLVRKYSSTDKMRRVQHFLLLLIFPNSLCLRHLAWPWTRAPYPQPLRVTREEVKLTQPSKDEINAKIMENMIRLIGVKFNIGKRSSGGKKQPKFNENTKKMENMIRLINTMKYLFLGTLM